MPPQATLPLRLISAADDVAAYACRFRHAALPLLLDDADAAMPPMRRALQHAPCRARHAADVTLLMLFSLSLMIFAAAFDAAFRH